MVTEITDLFNRLTKEPFKSRFIVNSQNPACMFFMPSIGFLGYVKPNINQRKNIKTIMMQVQYIFEVHNKQKL